MADEKAFVMTMRVRDSGPVPRELGESFVMTCDKCGEEVYTTDTSWKGLRDREINDYEIICNVCAIPMIETELKKWEDNGGTDVEKVMAGDPDLQPIIDGREVEFLRWMLARAKGLAGPIR